MRASMPLPAAFAMIMVRNDSRIETPLIGSVGS